MKRGLKQNTAAATEPRLNPAVNAKTLIGGNLRAYLATLVPVILLAVLANGSYLFFALQQLRTAEIATLQRDVMENAQRLSAQLALNPRQTAAAPGMVLFDETGTWLAGTLTESATAQLPQANSDSLLSGVNMPLWDALLISHSGNLQTVEGAYAYSRLCASACLADTGTAETRGLDGYLVGFIASTQLAPTLLLGNHLDQWLLLFLGIVVLSTVAISLALFAARDLSRLHQRAVASYRYHYLQESFFEKNPEIMFIKNLDGTYVSANKMCRRLAEFEGQAEDMAGKNRAELFPDQVATTMQQQDQQVIDNTEPMEFFTSWKRKDVTYHHKTLRFPLFDEDGNLTALGGIANDITDQAVARKALQESEQLVRTFIESAPEGVIICDTDGNITLVNRQAELIFGFERDELLSKSLFDVVTSLAEEDLNEAVDNARIISEEVFREAKEARGINKQNRNFPIELLLAPVSTNEGSLIICLLRDISEKLLMETQLRQSQKMEAIGKLTGGMAHDFNNLLGVIIGNIDLAMRKLDESTPGKKRLQTARQAAERGAELTKRMLAVARRQPLQPKPVSINSVVQELWEMLPQTLGPDVEMQHHLHDNLPPVIVDESGLEGIMLNLAVNARDAMPEGGKFTVTTAIKAGQELADAMPTITLRNAVYAYIGVEDTGTGMSQETVSRAFEPFYSTKEKGKGSGLGLAMIYGFVKQSKGYIFINSELGKGTRIDIYLPIRDAVAVDSKQLPKFVKEATFVKSETTILVVDDEPELLEVATTYLEDLGYAVLSAGSGQEALGVLAQHGDVDVLMTDVVMPGGMSGVALSKTAKELYPNLHVAYLSGYPTDIIEENSGDSLQGPLINKPYNRTSLANGVIEAMKGTTSSDLPIT